MEFDYVVVGGGSAGSVMAARLSEDGRNSVCLLEAGGAGKGILVRAPMAVLAMLPGYGKLNNWAYETVPQEGLGGRRGYQPRGRVLGGSSAINAMLYVRGHPTDYDEWAAAGATGWGWRDVLPYFKASEGNTARGDALHGTAGPLQVSDQRSPRPISRAFVEAAGECQFPLNDDFNGEVQEGAGLFQVTQFAGGARNGERCSAAAAYLHPVGDRDNLAIETKAQVTRVIVEEGRARGVEYRQGGTTKTVRARAEVILCGGAFNSPQLLMLSGIGPGAELARHGIATKVDAPGVGQNLQDHLDFILAYKTNTTDVLGIGLAGTVKIIREMLEWRRTGNGMVATPGAEGGAFLKSSPDLDRPDIQLHFVPGIVEDHSRVLYRGYGYSCHACLLRPESRGEVGLASPDPLSAPRIDPRYLSAEGDLEGLLKGVRMMRRIMNAPAMEAYKVSEIHTSGVADEDLASHIRARADTIYHPVGTVRMGGPDAPADPQGRVRGVDGLRVVDASLMPSLIGGNTNAPVIMMAEKIAAEMRAAG